MKPKKKKPLAEEFIDDLLDLDSEENQKGVHEDSTPELEAEVSSLFRAVEEEDEQRQQHKKTDQDELDTPIELLHEPTLLHHEIEDVKPARDESVFDEVSKLFVENLNLPKKAETPESKPQIYEDHKEDSAVYFGAHIEVEVNPVNLTNDTDDNTLKLSHEEISGEIPVFSAPPGSISPQDQTVVAHQDSGHYSQIEDPVGQSVDPQLEDRMRASVGRFAAIPGGLMHAPTTAALAQSENLRIAQARILELETEIERIRLENERLAAVGETFRKRSDSLATQVESSQERIERDRENFVHEKELLHKSLEAKTKEVDELSLRIDELETRLSSNIQKIRVRERELENRLELVKMENQALLRSKDEILLDLKRQVDQLNMELDNYRTKGQDLNRQLSDKQDMLRRTVKALRLALSMLEGEEDSNPLKRVK